MRLPRPAVKARRYLFPLPYFKGQIAGLVLPLLDKNGNCAWPEKFTPKKLAEIKALSGERKFMTQMQLVACELTPPRLRGEAIKLYDREIKFSERIRRLYLSLGDKPLVGEVCFWDPAWGRNLQEKGDGSVIAFVFFDCEGMAYLHRLVWLNETDEERGSMESQATRQCRRVAELVEQFLPPAVHVEATGLGGFLPDYLREILRARKMATEVVGAHPRGDKRTRILKAIEGRIATDGLRAHRCVADTPFFDELDDFNAEEIYARDDALDAVSQALELAPTPPPGARKGKKIEGRPWPKTALRLRPKPEPGGGLRLPVFHPISH